MIVDLQLHASYIQNKIHEIRGQKVMLDFDLAEMYSIETRVLNQAVKRNVERFPDDFMFQLTESEWHIMSSQIVMTLKSKRPKSALPFVFTEHGVTMLSSVLKSKIAINVNILVVRTFVAVRKLTKVPTIDKITQLQNEIREIREIFNDMLDDQNDINEDTRMQMEMINQSIADLQVDKKTREKPRRRIGFTANE